MIEEERKQVRRRREGFSSSGSFRICFFKLRRYILLKTKVNLLFLKSVNFYVCTKPTIPTLGISKSRDSRWVQEEIDNQLLFHLMQTSMHPFMLQSHTRLRFSCQLAFAAAKRVLFWTAQNLRCLPSATTTTTN